MQNTHNDDDKNLRKLREEQPSFTINTLVQWFLIPGLLGIVVTLFFVKIVIGVAVSMPRNEALGTSLNRIFSKLNNDIAQFLTLNWANIDLPFYMLIGFLLGVVIKYTYSDERIE